MRARSGDKTPDFTYQSTKETSPNQKYKEIIKNIYHINYNEAIAEGDE